MLGDRGTEEADDRSGVPYWWTVSRGVADDGDEEIGVDGSEASGCVDDCDRGTEAESTADLKA